MNAVTHGIFANSFLLRHPQAGENAADFDQLLAGLVNDYQPVGTQEELLVQDIAFEYVRQRRIQKFETGTIEAQLSAALPHGSRISAADGRQDEDRAERSSF